MGKQYQIFVIGRKRLTNKQISMQNRRQSGRVVSAYVSHGKGRWFESNLKHPSHSVIENVYQASEAWGRKAAKRGADKSKKIWILTTHPLGASVT